MDTADQGVTIARLMAATAAVMGEVGPTLIPLVGMLLGAAAARWVAVTLRRS